ncbi:MAG: response regulator transcription factor [Anaerolineales bacterium]|nr:MAG: response regulator transcription factor [Anaerolineales bacterium]
MIRVLVADDHPVVREGLSAIVDAEDDILVVGEAWNGEEAVRLAHQLHPDVVLMDLKMPKMDGVEAIQRIRAEVPETYVLILTTYADDDYIEAGIRAGARGYLLKDAPPDELVRAIRVVSRGESLLEPIVAAKVLDKLSALMTNSDSDVMNHSERTPSLTPRERETLILLASGARNKDIADALFISERTVKVHITSLMQKLDASTRTEAVARAIKQGLIELDVF